MAGFQALYFLNLRGDIIMGRAYRDDEDKEVSQIFRNHIINSRESATQTPPPVTHIPGRGVFVHMKYKDVYLLAITKSNANAMLISKYLADMVRLLRSYLQTPLGGDLSEDSIRQNFVVIYELLDETVDFGYPQITEPNILKNYITQRTLFAKLMSAGDDEVNKNVRQAGATLQVTGAVKHRPDGIRYKKNEVYLDVVEEVSVLVSGAGEILRADVQGRLMMKTMLSGMPDVKLGLSERAVENSVFHPCVNAGRFASERAVSFVPPDGEFELMRYSCSEGIQLPFKVIPVIKELARTRMQIDVFLRGTFPSNLSALNVVVRIPVPKYTGRTELVVSSGKVKFDATKNQVVWKIRKLPGMSECHLAAELGMIETIRDMKPWSRPPLQLEFQIPSHSASGLRVQYLKVWEKSGYPAERWVRKVCKSGEYSVRYPLSGAAGAAGGRAAAGAERGGTLG